jgi:hypothetical protein
MDKHTHKAIDAALYAHHSSVSAKPSKPAAQPSANGTLATAAA